MKTSKKNGKKAGESFSTEQLDSALMLVVDTFERASCQFFLLDETAKSIVKDGSLKGGAIKVGVKISSLTKEALSALNAVLDELFIEVDGDGRNIDSQWLTANKSWGTNRFEELRNKVKKKQNKKKILKIN